MGWGQGGEMIQVLYAHMNNKTIKKKQEKKKKLSLQKKISLINVGLFRLSISSMSFDRL
jgi:hypothetical protein